MKRLRGSAELRVNFAAGYQEALRDVKAKADTEGADAAIAYVNDNLQEETQIK